MCSHFGTLALLLCLPTVLLGTLNDQIEGKEQLMCERLVWHHDF